MVTTREGRNQNTTRGIKYNLVTTGEGMYQNKTCEKAGLGGILIKL